jgi:hypothetical protein
MSSTTPLKAHDSASCTRPAQVCNCEALPVVPLTEGVLACAARPLATAAACASPLPKPNRPSATNSPYNPLTAALGLPTTPRAAAAAAGGAADADADGAASEQAAELVTVLPAAPTSGASSECDAEVCSHGEGSCEGSDLWSAPRSSIDVDSLLGGIAAMGVVAAGGEAARARSGECAALPAAAAAGGGDACACKGEGEGARAVRDHAAMAAVLAISTSR